MWRGSVQANAHASHGQCVSSSVPVPEPEGYRFHFTGEASPMGLSVDEVYYLSFLGGYRIKCRCKGLAWWKLIQNLKVSSNNSIGDFVETELRIDRNVLVAWAAKVIRWIMEEAIARVMATNVLENNDFSFWIVLKVIKKWTLKTLSNPNLGWYWSAASKAVVLVTAFTRKATE